MLSLADPERLSCIFSTQTFNSNAALLILSDEEGRRAAAIWMAAEATR